MPGDDVLIVEVQSGEVCPVGDRHGRPVDRPVDIDQHGVAGIDRRRDGVGAACVGHVVAELDAVHDQPDSAPGPGVGDALVGESRPGDCGRFGRAGAQKDQGNNRHCNAAAASPGFVVDTNQDLSASLISLSDEKQLYWLQGTMPEDGPLPTLTRQKRCECQRAILGSRG